MTDNESQDIEERRRQLSVEEREAQAAYDREAISSAPVDRLKGLGDRLTVARVLLARPSTRSTLRNRLWVTDPIPQYPGNEPDAVPVTGDVGEA